MKLFKTPKLENNNQNGASKHKIVGVIDSSGSMSSVWKWVAEFWNQFIPADNAYTFTFDHDVHPVSDNRLQTNIKSHGGGRTDIPKAFDHLETKLKSFSSDTALTVIFISDGQDNNLNTLESRFQKLKGNTSKLYINFLCLGIESGFPTFLSMRIREKYHTGDATIPAIFLIEYSSEKAFYNKFESMKPYFTSAKSVNLCPGVIQYPWEDPKESVYENTWVMTDSSMVDVEGNLYDLSKDLINLEGLGEIVKGWLQMLNLESLKPGSSVQKFATVTLKAIEELFAQVKKEKDLDIIQAANESEVDFEKMTFLQRTLRNLVKYTLGRTVWYYQDIKNLAEGKSAKDINEYDAAKKIGVGTIAGKHQQKALALKGLTPEEFKKLADQFGQILCDIKHPTSMGMNYKPFHNQVSTLAQRDFLEGLDTCHNQFDLVEAFPFTGIAMRLKRFNGANDNPWLTQIKYLPKSNHIIDLVAVVKILNANIGNLSIKLDDGSSEMVNSVLPLYRKEEEHLAPLLTSKLHHLLMTFNMTNNVELLCEDAYLSLLANLLVFLLRENDSDWKTELLESLVYTVKLVYYKDLSFLKYREALMKAPLKTIDEDPEMKKYGVQDLSKPLLHLYMLCVDNVLNKTAIKDILDALNCHYFFSYVKKADFPINTYLKCKVKNTTSEKAAETIRLSFRSCYTMGDLRRKVYEAYEKIIQSGAQYEFIWDHSELYKLGDKFQVDLIDKISELFLKELPRKEEFFHAIAAAYTSGTLNDMINCMKKSGLDELSAIVGGKLSSSLKGNVKTLPAVVTAIDDMAKEFKEYFRDIHSEILPISYNDLKKECTRKGVSVNTLLYNYSSNLVRNACLAPKCPHYLKVVGRLSHHMDIWEYEIPEGFHITVKQNCNLNVDEIYAKFSATAVARSDRVDDGGGYTHKNIDYYFGKNVDLIEGYDEDKFIKTKEQVMNYIKVVKAAYENIEAQPK